MPSIGTMSDAELIRLGQEALQRLTSGEYARYAADRRVRNAVRQIAEMMYEATGNIPTGFLAQYFAMPEGAVPTARRIEEQRDLARWLAEQTGDITWAERFAPKVQLGEPTAAQRFADLGWSDWLRSQRGMTIDPRTGREVPVFDYLMGLARAAAQYGHAAGPEASPWFTSQPGPQGGGQAGIGTGAVPPAVQPGAPIDLSGLKTEVTPGRESVLNRFINTVRDLFFRYVPLGNPEVEQAFQAMKPELERLFPNRAQLARILATTPEEELNRQFGSPAMVARVRMWVAYGN